MPTQGFCERKLNVSEFLSYLEQDDRFWSATTVYVPCGKADRLYYRDVKAICPAMTTLINTQDLAYDEWQSGICLGESGQTSMLSGVQT
jgi:hypothetical protein